MFCAIYFIKIACSYLFTPALCFPLFLSLLPSVLAFASLYPRPEPDLLLDTPDLPVAVLFPTTFPYRDTPCSS